MNLAKMISELEAEKQRLDEAIIALERLSASKANRRSRTPRWTEVEASELSHVATPEDDLAQTENA